MRQLFHPSIADLKVESILHALSDPVRAEIFAGIAQSDCAQSCAAFLEVRQKPIPKSTLSQHFKALREAGLIRSERRGVEMHNTSRCAELARRFPGLIPAIVKSYHAQTSEEQKPAPRARKTGTKARREPR